MPSESPLTVVVVNFAYGESEAWGFNSPDLAKSFLKALEWHPGVTQSESHENGFVFRYEGVDGHTAEIDETVRCVAIDEQEWTPDKPHGEFDTTAFPMQGVPVRLVNEPPRHVIPRRLRSLVG